MTEHLDPRIGVLNSGAYYAFIDGTEVNGTRADVERALGIHERAAEVSEPTYTVTLRFQYPAWDEVNGIVYADVRARSKSEAIAVVRSVARDDGHTISGKGRYWFTAIED